MKSGALALFATGISGLPRFITEAAAGTQMLPMYKKNKTLVCVFQRGAMDGLILRQKLQRMLEVMIDWLV